jgi:drug/metabolite transporter (DMT)-like permease
VKEESATRMQASPKAQSDPAGHVIAAVKWMMVALFAFSLIGIAAREAGRGLGALDIMVYRSWLGVSILAIVQYGSGGSVVDLRTRQLPLLGLRSAVHFVAQYAWLVAVTMIPLAELFAIEFTAPLWTALLAPVFLKERLTGTRLVAAALGFIGILVVVSPGQLSSGPGTLFAFTAAVGFALHYLMTKHLTRQDSAFVLLFYTHLVQGFIALALTASTLKVPMPVTALWVVALTVLGLFAHYALARAFALADAIVVAPMDFLRLPLIAVVGAVLYDEPLASALVIGAAIIVAANFVNLLGERQRRLVPPIARPSSRPLSVPSSTESVDAAAQKKSASGAS